MRLEHQHYVALDGHPYLPRLLGWHDDGDEPALVIEDLSQATWPPPWSTSSIDLVLDTLEDIHRTPPPRSVDGLVGDIFDFEEGWVAMQANPAGALALGVFDTDWLDAHIAELIAAAASAAVAGSTLLHRDVRGDNLCFHQGVAMLIDWNLASRGSEVLDLASWLPSLHMEGGPEPWAMLPDQGPLARLLAGFFLEHAGREPIPQAPHVRQLQLDQGRSALAWACRELRIPPPR